MSFDLIDILIMSFSTVIFLYSVYKLVTAIYESDGK